MCASKGIGTARRGFMLWPRGIGLYLGGFLLQSVGIILQPAGIVLANKGITALSSAYGTDKRGIGYAKKATALANTFQLTAFL